MLIFHVNPSNEIDSSRISDSHVAVNYALDNPVAAASPAHIMDAGHDTEYQSNDDEKLAEHRNSEDEDESSDSDYYSATDDSDDEGVEGDSNKDREAREKERQRVLEAAGLIVNEDVKPPPKVERARSTRIRRPAPAAPQRSSVISNTSVKDLPPVPQNEDGPIEPTVRLDDAFDRYEAFKKTQSSNNRLSVASSFETGPSSPTSGSPSITPSISRDGEGRGYIHLLSFLGRKTPANETSERRTLNISAPILNISDSPSRDNSPAFGSVSATLCCARGSSEFGSHGRVWWIKQSYKSCRKASVAGKRQVTQ